jgi:hypothetical protein
MVAPKDREANKRFRAEILQKAENDLELQAVLRQKCAGDKIFFIDTFCWTFDPRLSDPVIPFILYPKQEALILWLDALLERSRNNEKVNALIDKPRDVGATFTVMTWCLAEYLFDEFTARVGSRKEDYVDKKGEPDTLFYKLDFNLERLPKWLLPSGYSSECRPAMLLKHPTNTNGISGESANPNFGRGGRKSVTVFDEHAFWEWAKSSWESAGESTNFRLSMSTPPESGKDSHFYKLRTAQLGKVEVFEFNWNDVPTRDEAWLTRAKESKSEEELAREVLKSYDGTVKGKVYALDLRLVRLTECDFETGSPLFISWDFGLDTVAMIWWLKDMSRNRLKIIDSYWNSNKSMDFYLPFVTGEIVSIPDPNGTPYTYSEYELDIIGRHKNWSREITHYGDPDVKKRAVKDGESTKDYLQKKGIYIQSKDWSGRTWTDLRDIAKRAFRRIEINEKRNEYLISALRNAKYPERRENSQSQNEPIKPVHDWTSHFRSSFEYFLDNEPEATPQGSIIAPQEEVMTDEDRYRAVGLI